MQQEKNDEERCSRGRGFRQPAEERKKGEEGKERRVEVKGQECNRLKRFRGLNEATVAEKSRAHNDRDSHGHTTTKSH